jgi:2,3,4,5-tetrahydropyridine-2-carboxylate N-succinyltransferase
MTVVNSPVSPVIDDLSEERASLSPRDAEARCEVHVTEAVDLLDTGTARVARVDDSTDEVLVDERANRAVLLSFKVLEMTESQVGDFRHHDRTPLKKRLDGVRMVPGAIARWGSYLAPGTVLMP